MVFVLSLGLVLALSGCGNQGHAQARTPETNPPALARGIDPSPDDAGGLRPCVGWPKRTAFLFDQTGSSTRTRTEHPPVDKLTDVIECAKQHGGSIYAGAIRDRSNQPFAHLLLEPEPAKPPGASLTGNALIDVDHAADHDRAMKEYEKRHGRWVQDANASIAAFCRSAGPLLAQPANARTTDLVTAVERAYVALDEPTTLRWLVNAPRVLVVVSDNEDTATRRRVPAAAFPLVLITVNGNGLTGDLAPLHPLRFESFDSMLTYVTGGRHV
jgi:hypothetical protein